VKKQVGEDDEDEEDEHPDEPLIHRVKRFCSMEDKTKLENVSRMTFLPLVEEYYENSSKKMAFFLCHPYPSGITIDNLKGADRVLYDILKEKFMVELSMCVSKYETDYDGNVASDDKKRIGIVDSTSLQIITSFIYGKIEDIEKLESIFKERDANSVNSIDLFFGGMKHFDSVSSTTYEEYRGNGAQLGEYEYRGFVLNIIGTK
jgi:hypothetical protein